MTLIKSISGFRGTIGGKEGDSFTPNDIVKFVAAFGSWLKGNDNQKRKIVIGRDARISGEIVSKIVSGTLQSIGLDVVDLTLTTTPTLEMAVPNENALGGIIITASHNPMEWNALKLVNHIGEFVSAKDIQEILEIADSVNYSFSEIADLGSYCRNNEYLDYHVDKIKALPLVNTEAIKRKKFKVIVDAVNSTGGMAIQLLLEKLGVESIEILNSKPTGIFSHNPEPTTENLTELITEIKKGNYDIGIAVDPDVDRLVFICEDGTPFNEEYTLVAISDYVLSHTLGNTVSNLSSTLALRDITKSRGGQYFASAVGEVNVVEKMKEVNAVIGGEGNGGVIYPDLHYGRDALVGIGLMLSYLATSDCSMSQLKSKYPSYFMYKHKVDLQLSFTMEKIISNIKQKYPNQPINTIDGVKIELDEKSWVHLRKSNTEAIMRIYSESATYENAKEIAFDIIKLLF